MGIFLRSLVPFIPVYVILARQGGTTEPLKNVVSQRLLLSFGKECDEATASARVLSSLLASQVHGEHNPHFKQEEAVVKTESVADFAAYSRSVFSFKTAQFQEAVGAAEGTEQSGTPSEELQTDTQDEMGSFDVSRVVRCRISQTTLKLVGVSVVSLEACPSVDPPVFKDAFEQDSCIISVEFDSLIRLNASKDESTEKDEDVKKESPTVEYWQELIQLEAARAIGVCKREVIVGVIDSGVAYDHPALKPNMWTNTKEVPDNGIDDDENGYIDDVYGYNFIDKNGNPTDALGHGTHVAGIIGAVPGYTRACGVCKETSIAALRFMDKHGTGTTALAIEALNYAVQMKFQVSCNSWGGPGLSLMLRQAIVQAYKANHLFIAAAGNKGLSVDFIPEFPAAFGLPNIITVAASNEEDKLARFSNYGSIAVHLTAPGVNIYSTFPPESFTSLSGTSMAAPIVAAVCAMLLSVKEKSLENVRLAVLSSVDKLPQLKGRVKTGGRLNALKALKAYLEDKPLQLVPAVSFPSATVEEGILFLAQISLGKINFDSTA